MKTLLIMLLVSICAIAWRSDDLMRALGVAKVPVAPQTVTAEMSAQAKPSPGQTPMTVEQFTELAKKDPQAYQKFIRSMQVQAERSEADKLMNSLAHGKYK
jgi:hypothetical protein